MTKIVNLRVFWIFAFIMPILPAASPCISIAQDRVHGYQGHYSNELKRKIDIAASRIRENLKSYNKDKYVAHLDDSHNIIIQSVEEIHTYLKTAAQRLRDLPEHAELQRLNAQIDKLEIINIRDVELPFLCNQLYEVGQLYIKADKNKARQCFSDIVSKFTSYESNSCNEKAENALKHLK